MSPTRTRATTRRQRAARAAARRDCERSARRAVVPQPASWDRQFSPCAR
jgi:hypothetical protein